MAWGASDQLCSLAGQEENILSQQSTSREENTLSQSSRSKKVARYLMATRKRGAEDIYEIGDLCSLHQLFIDCGRGEDRRVQYIYIFFMVVTFRKKNFFLFACLYLHSTSYLPTFNSLF